MRLLLLLPRQELMVVDHVAGVSHQVADSAQADRLVPALHDGLVLVLHDGL